MKSPLMFLLMLQACMLSAQGYQIGHVAVTFTDSSRNNRSIPVEIYYPADVTGDNVPFTSANSDPFPVLCFGHGFVMTWSAYQNIWSALVPEGFIIVFPRTETGISTSHMDFGLDLAFMIMQLMTLGQDSTSLFWNRVDSMNCVMGHSMGGGASFLAAQQSSGIKTIAALAPAETTPSAIQACADLTIPALIIAGGNDCVTPPSNHQIPMYNALNSSCKTYVSITGGSHCQMADYNLLCSIGEMSCTPPPAISREEQHLIINRYLLPWLAFELKNDCLSGTWFDSTLLADPAVTWLKNCSLCLPSGMIDNEALIPSVYPNPFTTYLDISVSRNESLECRLFDTSMRLLKTASFSGQLRINTADLSPGCYYIELKAGDKVLYRSTVVRH
ncbi:MAG TPA: T9SS type A sorting domain-containing protein [Bacteroidales bacterium]|nr:T9SS type A sorting domain-containing protein [Bacteroidales bacterium]HSA43743.1 T9SS type A sorting domain-containing protein [Bacteroidales bacterium]